MKNLLMLSILMIIAIKGFSQAPIKLDGLYVFTQPTKLNVTDAIGTAKQFYGDTALTISSDWRFYIERKMPNNDLIISFVKWSTNQNAKAGSLEESQSNTNKDLNQNYRKSDNFTVKRYFYLPFSEFQLSCKEIESKIKFTVGTATTLIKYRPGSKNIPGDIGNDINIGLLAGFQIVRSDYLSHYFLLGVNFGSVKLTPKTTNNTLSTESNVASITPTLGYVLEYDKVQLGLFTGIDILSGDAYRNWIYRGRPWVGFGIGFSIFKATSTLGATQPSP